MRRPLCLLAAALLSCSTPAPAPGAAGRAPAEGGQALADCQADADCALTRVPAGGCCPTLCAPRAVTKERQAALAAARSACGPCAVPPCRPSAEVVAACVAGRCLAVDPTRR